MKSIRIFTGALFTGVVVSAWFIFLTAIILNTICANNRDWLKAFDFELPMVGVSQVAVDQEGNIYCGSSFDSRVQVYSSKGRYLRGFFVPSEKEFRMSIDHKGQLVLATRFDNQYTLDASGKIIEKKHHSGNFYNQDLSTRNQFRTKDGDLYKADDHLPLDEIFWRIRRVKPDLTIETPVSFPLSTYVYFFPFVLVFFQTYLPPSKAAERKSLESAKRQPKTVSISTIGLKHSPTNKSVDFSKAKVVSHNCYLGATSDVRFTRRGVLLATDEAIFHQPYDSPDLEMRMFLWEIASVQKNGFSFANLFIFPGLESHYKIKMNDNTNIQLILMSESKAFESLLSDGSVKLL